MRFSFQLLNFFSLYGRHMREVPRVKFNNPIPLLLKVLEDT